VIVNIAFIILTALTFVDCALLIGLILAQKKSAAGFTSAMGGMSSSAPSYWDKNKGRSLEGKLELYTKICAALFIIFVIACNVVSGL
jgi:preprotein translocase subunit SecG